MFIGVGAPQGWLDAAAGRFLRGFRARARDAEVQTKLSADTRPAWPRAAGRRCEPDRGPGPDVQGHRHARPGRRGPSSAGAAAGVSEQLGHGNWAMAKNTVPLCFQSVPATSGSVRFRRTSQARRRSQRFSEKLRASRNTKFGHDQISLSRCSGFARAASACAVWPPRRAHPSAAAA